MNDHDHDLRALFTRERQSETHQAPVFQHMLTRARQQAQPSPHHRLRWALTTMAITLLAIAAMPLFVPAPKPASLSRTLPVFLAPQDSASPLFANLGSDSTPSDFLMPRHVTFKVL